jgi:hypothetical protein
MTYGIRMVVAGRDLGWIEQEGKPLLFSDRAEAEQHAAVLDALSAAVLDALSKDAEHDVAPWPDGEEQ